MNGELRRVGVVANLRPVKGIDIFIRAAALVVAEFPSVLFPIAGDGDPVPYRKLAEECGVAEKVQFLGPVEDIPAFLAQLDVAVLPSRAEGLSNALLEYMAAGLPVVATDVGGTRELLGGVGAGNIVPALAPDALAERICQLLADQALRNIIGENARTKAYTVFAKEQILHRYSLLYTRLAGDGSGGTP